MQVAFSVEKKKMQALLSKAVNLSRMMLLANINRASVSRKPLSREKKKSFSHSIQQYMEKKIIRKLNIAFLKQKTKPQDSLPFVLFCYYQCRNQNCQAVITGSVPNNLRQVSGIAGHLLKKM